MIFVKKKILTLKEIRMKNDRMKKDESFSNMFPKICLSDMLSYNFNNNFAVVMPYILYDEESENLLRIVIGTSNDIVDGKHHIPITTPIIINKINLFLVVVLLLILL